MPYIPVEDTVLCELFLRLQGEQAENTLYFLNAGGWTTTAMTTLATSLAAWWVAEIATEVSNELSLVGIKVTDLSSQFAASIYYPVTPPETGDDAEDPLPNNAAAVIKFTTESRGRSFRGRNYIPGIPDAYVNGNTIDPAIVLNLIDGYQNLDAVETTNSCVHVVVSRYSLGAPRVAGLATEVTAYDCQPTIRTQRRRLPR